MSTDESTFVMREHVTGTGASTTVVIELSGEIDIHASLALAPRTDQLIAGYPPEVVVDLRQVTFLDGGGLRLLDRVQARAVARGGRLRVISGTTRVMRVFRLACAERDFVFLDPDDLPAVSDQDGGRSPRAMA